MFFRNVDKNWMEEWEKAFHLWFDDKFYKHECVLLFLWAALESRNPPANVFRKNGDILHIQMMLWMLYFNS